MRGTHCTERQRRTISCILSMTYCKDHSRLVISITSGSLPFVPGISTSRVLPMDGDVSTRNIVTVYWWSVSMGKNTKTTPTYSCTFRWHGYSLDGRSPVVVVVWRASSGWLVRGEALELRYQCEESKIGRVRVEGGGCERSARRGGVSRVVALPTRATPRRVDAT